MLELLVTEEWLSDGVRPLDPSDRLLWDSCAIWGGNLDVGLTSMAAQNSDCARNDAVGGLGRGQSGCVLASGDAPRLSLRWEMPPP